MLRIFKRCRMFRLFTLLALVSVISFSSAVAQEFNEVQKQTLKFQRLLALIDAFYVENTEIDKISEKAIISMLAELDPHSVYISKEEVKEMNEPLDGGFFGIGIQFNILRDTLMVVATVPGGPSEKVGVLPGDRIVEIDNENIAGTGLTNSGVRKRLKGEKGTVVEIKVKRSGAEGILDFRIIRDRIPIHSLSASYMLDDNTGYIKLDRFAATTIDEFEKAVLELQSKGMKDLIFDLSGNSGGYLGAAIGISDHFLDNDKLIVYTDGRASGRRNSFATDAGYFQDGRLVVLIDENSASASEIVSGAVQDWDRGIILGRRSFGKGLVQRQFPLTDTSMIRLTTAHYYTPSGRCIQKPYDKGIKDYRLDILKRYATGELVNKDSIHLPDSIKYNTRRLNRVVYGGGGIMPDIFVGIDTTINYSYLNMLSRKNVIYPWVVDYVDKNRQMLENNYPDIQVFKDEFVVSEKIINEIVKEGEKVGVKKDDKLLNEVRFQLKMHIKSLIARDLWDMNELYMIANERNEELKKAIEILKNGRYEKILRQN